jgi:hypothetical protein
MGIESDVCCNYGLTAGFERATSVTGRAIADQTNSDLAGLAEGSGAPQPQSHTGGPIAPSGSALLESVSQCQLILRHRYAAAWMA